MGWRRDAWGRGDSVYKKSLKLNGNIRISTDLRSNQEFDGFFFVSKVVASGFSPRRSCGGGGALAGLFRGVLIYRSVLYRVPTKEKEQEGEKKENNGCLQWLGRALSAYGSSHEDCSEKGSTEEVT